MSDLDFDWIVVGSGFGGSVSALRLAERGYSVCVLECGRRFADHELPGSGWKLRNYVWAPQIGMRGILRMSLFRDVAILSGAGVGGGSLVYAATLYRAVAAFEQRLAAACGEPVDLAPHYAEAERMLGVVANDRPSVRDEVLRELADEQGYGWHPSRVGIFLGAPGRTVPDPFFGGDGPARTGCIGCGECIAGCRHGAKNTLDKNYLWMAERRGAVIEADRQVVEVRPLRAVDGADGYAVVARRPGAWVRRDERVLRARGVVFAAGAIGTNRLLAGCRHGGALPALSTALGAHVRTNAESVCALTARDPRADLSRGVTLGSSSWPRPGLHFEPFGYGGVLDAMKLYFVPFTPDGTRLTRPLKMVGTALRHPCDVARAGNPRGWSRRTMSLGAMEDADGELRFASTPRRFGRGVRLATREDPDNPVPTFIPELYEAVERLAEKLDAIPQSFASEALLSIPFTAHILGGAVIATDPGGGVVDSRHRVYGYRNLLVCDGSAVPGNAGVNPSLTIAAMAERAMSLVPARDAAPAVAAGGASAGTARRGGERSEAA